MKKPRLKSGKVSLLFKTNLKKRTLFLVGLVAISFFCTIYVQGFEDLKSSSLKLFNSSSNEIDRNPLESLFIVVPYRNRVENRRVFVAEMKKYLQKKVRFIFLNEFRIATYFRLNSFRSVSFEMNSYKNILKFLQQHHFGLKSQSKLVIVNDKLWQDLPDIVLGVLLTSWQS